MVIYFSALFFIIGIIFGSFYNVVGYRLPRGESLLFPSSHCTNCNHKLGPLELIPIFSYIFQGGKCKHCKSKISLFYPLFEFFSGLMFMVSYLIFGLSLNCLLSITFISMILIIIISDYQYMIINDSVLIVFSILIIIELFFINGLKSTGISILNGILSFIVMYLIKLLGDFLFKKESMGGGDIKLLFVFGLVLGLPLSIISIFLASIIALPISIILLKKNTSHEVPFGPYLGIAAIILFLSRIDLNFLASILTF